MKYESRELTLPVRVSLRAITLLAFVVAAGTPPILAQAAPPPAPPAEHTAEQPERPQESAVNPAHVSGAEPITDAWRILETALKDKKPEIRIAAVTAMGTISPSERAAAKVEEAMADPDRDVRLAAVAAAGAMKSPLLIPALRKMLDDPAVDISFTASTVLWNMGDKSGQEILAEVVAGERKGTPGALRSGLHKANKDLHSPTALATIGAEQTAYALMGPFGLGIDAAQMVVKGKNNENSARVAAVTLLSSDKSSLTNRQLLAALYDKDYFVRAAAARGLGDFHNADTAKGLLAAFDDEKPLVRFMAAAGYIRSTTIQSRKGNSPVRSGFLKKSPTSSPGIPPAANPTPTVPSQPNK